MIDHNVIHSNRLEINSNILIFTLDSNSFINQAISALQNIFRMSIQQFSQNIY
ncbi:hypothetical protein pb186bvf_001942 [Paramecium bursaria]